MRRRKNGTTFFTVLLRPVCMHSSASVLRNGSTRLCRTLPVGELVVCVDLHVGRRSLVFKWAIPQWSTGGGIGIMGSGAPGQVFRCPDIWARQPADAPSALDHDTVGGRFGVRAEDRGSRGG